MPPINKKVHNGNCSFKILQAKQRKTSLAQPDPLPTRRSVEHCTPHADGAWLNELGHSSNKV